MKLWTRPNPVGLFLLLLVLSATWMAAGANAPNRMIIFPDLDQAIVDPADFYSQAATHENLLLLKAAIFDPLRDGEPNLERFMSDYLQGQPLASKYYLLQFQGRVDPAKKEALKKAGAAVFEYVPNNAFLVRLSDEVYRQVKAMPGIRWIGNLQPAYKISPELVRHMPTSFQDADRDEFLLSVEFFPNENLNPLIEEIQSRYSTAANFVFHQSGPCSYICNIPTRDMKDFLTYLANSNETKWVETRELGKPRNDNSIWVVQSGDSAGKTTPIFAKGIMGDGQVIGVMDSGCDRDMCFYLNAQGSPILASQKIDPPGALAVDATQRKIIAYNVLQSWLYPTIPHAHDGDESIYTYHGTHTTGSAAGDNFLNLADPGANPPNAGHNPGDGMAPRSKVVFIDGGHNSFQAYQRGIALLFGLFELSDLLQQEYDAGVNISSNSWGGSQNNYYGTSAQQIDTFTWLNEDFLTVWAQGNTDAGELPGTEAVAKNLVAVGATSNGSSGANDMGTFSVKGPTRDGRYKPDVAAPGTNINSALGTGSLADFNCGTKSAGMSGTSMSTPTAAGAAALARQYFTEGWYPNGTKARGTAFVPSAALLKAVLINSCVNMSGTNTGGDYDHYSGYPKNDAPANGQGWGRVTLDNTLYFSGDNRKLLVWDIPNNQGLTTGLVRDFPITVAAGQPLKATLVWTDPPGSVLSSYSLVNNLDLELIGPSQNTYRGNQWNNLQTTGDTKESLANPAGWDTVNNVEGILIKAPVAGDYILRVKGTNVPGVFWYFTQGFGLVVTGNISTRTAPVVILKSMEESDAAGDNDGFIDPGDTVNMTIELMNTGATTANNVTGTLSTTTPGITVTANNKTFGNIPFNAVGTNAVPFTYTVASNVPNGTPINFTLQVTSTPGGPYTLNFRTWVVFTAPGTAPTLTQIVITEGGEAQSADGGTVPQLVEVDAKVSFADPDGDVSDLHLFPYINGQPVGISHFYYWNIANYASQLNPIWFDLNPYWFFGTNKGEHLKFKGYIEDSMGNCSAIVESNEITFTKGCTATTPDQMDDDNTCYVPFASGFLFPFFGKTYSGCWINSDGNITFEGGYDNSFNAPGSLYPGGRDPVAFLMTIPRIAAIYTDLAKAPGDGKITFTATASQFSVTFSHLKQWASTGPTGDHTFTFNLFPNGNIDVVYGTCTVTESQEDYWGTLWKGIVGVSPGAYYSGDPDGYAGMMTDLSAATRANITIPPHQPVWQAFKDTDTFDLSGITLHYVPFDKKQTLYFPRMSFRLNSWVDGYGFVNSSNNPAQLRFTAYDTSGTAETSSNPLALAAKNQAAYNSDGLLNVPGTDVDFWVIAESDQTGIKAFFETQELVGGLAGLDGAEAVGVTLTSGVVPRVKTVGSYDTELFVANPGTEIAVLTCTGYDGTNVYNANPVNIPPKGFVKLDVFSLFRRAFDGYLKIQSTVGVVGNAVIKDSNVSISSINIQPSSSYAQTLYAAHLALMPNVYYTEVNLDNPNATAATVTITPYRADGTTFAAPFQVTVPANQCVTLRDTALGLPAGETSEGWLKVDSTLAIVGCLTFGNPVDNHYMATLPLQSSGAMDYYFAHVADGLFGSTSFFTGLAVVNPGETTASVTIAIYSTSGALLGQVTVNLPARQKYVRLLQFIEGMPALPDPLTGYIRITSNKNIYTFELFGDDVLSFLSAVPAQK